MDFQVAILLVIIAWTLAAFVREWLPLDVVALTTLALLLIFDLVTPQEAIAGFSNDAVITVMMMFVLSDGLVRSGMISRLALKIAQYAGDSHRLASVALMTFTGFLSAFINNTAAVGMFMPVAIHLGKHYRVSPSKLLLPLSFAGIIGGTCTLIGTSTNLLVSSLAVEAGQPAFGLFEFAGLGLVLFAVGMVYNVFIGMRLLPDRGGPASLTRKYKIGGYLTELRIPEGSPLVGRTVFEENVSSRFELNVLEVIRGREKITTDLRNTRLAVGDVLIVRAVMDDILAFKSRYKLLLLTDVKLNDTDLADERNVLQEVQLSPTSRLAGLSLAEIDFRKRYGSFVLALKRPGELMRRKIAFIPLKHWDTLLVFGPRARVEALNTEDDFLPLEELEVRLHLSKYWWRSLVILPVVVLLAAFGVMSILEASIVGVVAMILTRVLTIQQAYKAINWTVIFLIAAILPLGTAMEKTGLARQLGEGLAAVGADWGPLALIAMIYIATSLLTEFLSNASAAVLMVPIAVATAQTLGLDERALLMAVTFAASSSFLSPVGYQTNAMVHGPGDYRIVDYLRTGGPLKLIFLVLTTFLIPVFWPLGG